MFGASSAAAGATPTAARHRARRDGALCREAERSISLALQAADDPMLHRLLVIAVRPAPDAARLLVLLACPRDVDASAAEAAVRGAAPILRAELARALQRSKTPELAFVALPDGAVRADEDGDP
jgi:ribosome-binding factor A